VELKKELGLAALALQVFAHNHGERAIYEQLGYELKSITITKGMSWFHACSQRPNTVGSDAALAAGAAFERPRAKCDE
jgi:hypothetical protein